MTNTQKLLTIINIGCDHDLFRAIISLAYMIAPRQIKETGNQFYLTKSLSSTFATCVLWNGDKGVLTYFQRLDTLCK